jgi:5,10-methylenetetrahydrofolate reductase
VGPFVVAQGGAAEKPGGGAVNRPDPSLHRVDDTLQKGGLYAAMEAALAEPERREPSRLERLLRNGDFVITAEMSPPDSANPHDVYSRAETLLPVVDSINATDASGANCHMSSLAVCALLLRAGCSPVMQISCRDRNRIAIQGDVLGAAALGITNILCLSGDGVQTGDHPDAKPVFDLDSVSLLGTIRKLRDQGQFLSGRPISNPPRLFLGAAENPSSPPIEMRVARLQKKIEAGAQFIQTQYCFDIPRLREFMTRVRDLGLHRKVFLIAGVGPLASPGSARWIRTNVPGVHIPEDIIRRLEAAPKPKQEGRRICVELMQQIKEIPGIAGIHVMAFKQEEFVREMVNASGVIADRKEAVPR